MKSTLPILLVIALALAAPLRADLNSDLAFSAFAGQSIDLNALAGGQVLQARGPIMTFPRGITLAGAVRHRCRAGRCSQEALHLEPRGPFRAQGLAA